MKKILNLVTVMALSLGTASVAHAQGNYNVQRLYGKDRYKTAISIANKVHVENSIIVASGKNFPDALAGSVLVKKFHAPIVLAGTSKSENADSIQYIKNNLNKNDKIYLLGGEGSVNEDFFNTLKAEGFKNFIRLGGKDRFETNKSIVKCLNVPKNTPVVIVNAYGFADALSISSIASEKNYPIIMTSDSKLSNEAYDMLREIKPSQVYVIGGQASVSDSVVEEIKEIVPSLTDNKIKRLQGQNRYETSLSICKYFNFNTDNAVIANGSNFPDALAGSALATKLNTPVMLTDGNNIETQKTFLDSKDFKNIYLLGGLSSIDTKIEFILKGSSNIPANQKEFINNLLTYCDKFFEENSTISNDIIAFYDKIFSDSNIDLVKNPSKSSEMLDKIIDGYKNLKTSLLTHNKNMCDLKTRASKLQNPEELIYFSDQYTKNINSYTQALNKFINLCDLYIKAFNNLKEPKLESTIKNQNSTLTEIKNLQIPTKDAAEKLNLAEHSMNDLAEHLMEINGVLSIAN